MTEAMMPSAATRLAMVLILLTSLTACSVPAEYSPTYDADVAWGLGANKLSKSPAVPPVVEPSWGSSPAVPAAAAPRPPASATAPPAAPAAAPPASPPPQVAEDPRERSLTLAGQARRNGDGLTATALYQQVLADAPDDPEARLGLVHTLMDGEQAGEAKRLVAELVKKRPTDPAVLVAAVRLDLAGGDIAAAAAHVALAMSRAPDDRDVLMAEGMVDDMRGNHALAERAYRKILAGAPDDEAAANNLALTLMAEGDPAGAATLLSPFAKDPQSAMPVVRHDLAMAYGLAGRDREARALLELDLSPEEIDSNLKYYGWLRARIPKKRYEFSKS